MKPYNFIIMNMILNGQM